MPITVVNVPITLDAAGAGTATTRTVRGEILAFWIGTPGTALLTGGSADFTITHAPVGGTVLAVSNVAAAGAAWQPREAVHSTAGVSFGSAVDTGIPVAGSVTVTVAQGALSASGTAHLYVRI